MKTAMQDLREDLIISIGTCNKALEEIKDLRTREACQAVVNLTIDNILNRIDTELLEKEKIQIENAYHQAQIDLVQVSNEASIIDVDIDDAIEDREDAEAYYRVNYKSE
jgi:hypothetical protein